MSDEDSDRRQRFWGSFVNTVRCPGEYQICRVARVRFQYYEKGCFENKIRYKLP